TAIDQCICCGTIVRYTPTAPCFKCTVCDTVSDLSTNRPISARRLRAALTLSKLNAAVVAYNHDPTVAAHLQLMISDCFGNIDALNHSFLNDNSSTSTLDYFVRTMMLAIDKLLKRPGRPLRRKEDIRWLIILLENPILRQLQFPQESVLHLQITRRLIGIVSGLSNRLHHYLVSWTSRQSIEDIKRKAKLVNGLITHRLDILLQQQQQQQQRDQQNQQNQQPRIFAKIFETIDLAVDFDVWQQRMAGKFAFCQYPLLLPLSAKMTIIRLDAWRQMESKVRETFFTSLTSMVDDGPVPYLELRVRRSNLISDSLTQIARNQHFLKKKLRINFIGEEGIDAGGLTKEWFMLLIRDLMSVDFGLFEIDSDSQLNWFRSDYANQSDDVFLQKYFLTGIVIGLAIYNSTILDIRLPLACYKKLIGIKPTFVDFIELRPALGNGLRTLLDFGNHRNDVPDGMSASEAFSQAFYGITFTASVYDRYGRIVDVPLVHNGENIPVSWSNREEYVNRYTNFVLDTSVSEQFTIFKRGFDMVCGGNALTLFRPEEIELLVCGSREPVDVGLLRNVAIYEGFDLIDEDVEAIKTDFWAICDSMNEEQRRKLLVFVTGSDRLPAPGAT
ncbi:hypothetical protein GQ42DRAFT_109092, partial [Ramicandelaber brevisporus]